MAKQKDPSITFLNKWGYNVVKLPRTGIEPLDVVGVEKSAQWLGPLGTVWTSKTPVPVPSPPRPAAAINGQKTDSLDASVGLSVLANALTAFGASSPSLNAAYNGARKMQFAYTNVTETVVSPFDAGNYLAGGELGTTNPVVKRYFQDPHCQAYLITSVLKSDSITVNASDDKGGNVDVEIPQISQLLGASIKVAPTRSTASSLTFTGPQPVTFGFIVQQITFSNGVWSLNDAPASGHLAFSNDPSAASAENTSSKGVIFQDPDGDCRIDLSSIEAIS